MEALYNSQKGQQEYELLSDSSPDDPMVRISPCWLLTSVANGLIPPRQQKISNTNHPFPMGSRADIQMARVEYGYVVCVLFIHTSYQKNS